MAVEFNQPVTNFTMAFMTGPLTGTPVVLSGRHGVAGRSPLTGFWGESSVGGHWGREFRRTGYDGMILLGKADRPAYLSLQDDRLEIKDAGHLWGKDCFETDRILKKECGDKIQVSCIGPAAEKLVAEIKGQGKSGISIQMDVSVEKDVERTVKQTLENFGKIDILPAGR
jgi:aldehyde:ferredoxin oxidoreductase